MMRDQITVRLERPAHVQLAQMAHDADMSVSMAAAELIERALAAGWTVQPGDRGRAAQTRDPARCLSCGRLAGVPTAPCPDCPPESSRPGVPLTTTPPGRDTNQHQKG